MQRTPAATLVTSRRSAWAGRRRRRKNGRVACLPGLDIDAEIAILRRIYQDVCHPNTCVGVWQHFTRRTDDLHDLYDLFPIHDLDL